MALLTLYDAAEFAHLLRTGVSRSGFKVERMAWLPEVEFTDQDIADLYEFLTQQVLESRCNAAMGRTYALNGSRSVAAGRPGRWRL